MKLNETQAGVVGLLGLEHANETTEARREDRCASLHIDA
jgi:hypothetical protein